jgi:hypothetical protein
MERPAQRCPSARDARRYPLFLAAINREPFESDAEHSVCYPLTRIAWLLLAYAVRSEPIAVAVAAFVLRLRTLILPVAKRRALVVHRATSVGTVDRRRITRIAL